MPVGEETRGREVRKNLSVRVRRKRNVYEIKEMFINGELK